MTTVNRDEHEYQMWGERGDPVLHIELRKWADLMLIAPLSANTLAKIANGLSDNLATLVCRCWDMTLKPYYSQTQPTEKGGGLVRPALVCPAMNSLMWDHPVTAQQLAVLRHWGYTVVGPVVKTLMCGEVGTGAMSSVPDIVQAVGESFDRGKEPRLGQK